MDKEPNLDKDGKRPAWRLLIIRLLAGGYLIYLAVHLPKQGGDRSGFFNFAVPGFFLIAGVLIGGWALLKLIKRDFEQ